MDNFIINSLLDTDLYKFTMMQCVMHHFPLTQVAYQFKCRKPVKLAHLAKAIEEQISHLCQLRLTEDELAYLASLPFFKADFIDFLKSFTLNTKNIQVSVKDDLNIKIQGPWLETILFEVPVLAIVSEVYYRHTYPNSDLTLAKERLNEKIAFIQQDAYRNLRFSDFGTRRRFSKNWHEQLIGILKEKCPIQFNGTSNTLFAKQMDLKPIGTMAHEYLQAFQVLAPQLKGSQKFALNIWLEEYKDKLGIALTDTLTMDVFLQEFDKDLAMHYSGLRQDSGDPIAWGEKALKHYEKLGIDPKNKVFVFSDNLTFEKMANIFSHFKDKCQPYFGIGTNLTNDVGYTPLDIVIKMTHTNHHPVIKISDSKGKLVSEDESYLHLVKETFQLQEV
ncbi:MAG: nicotinate phosphoribosyltransferase [Proteobacteria bacterium]|nr:nicotinate phosphoribosyltransferase [Pseudomonadota bacterium]